MMVLHVILLSFSRYFYQTVYLFVVFPSVHFVRKDDILLLYEYIHHNLYIEHEEA